MHGGRSLSGTAARPVATRPGDPWGDRDAPVPRGTNARRPPDAYPAADL